VIDPEQAVDGGIAGGVQWPPGPHSLDELAYQRLRGKVVILTGAGRGIGRSAARRIAAEGGRVVIVDYDAELAHAAAAEISAAGGDATAVIADLRDYAACAHVAAAVSGQAGQINVLVNNVGGATDLKPFLSWTPEEISAEVSASLLPTLWCCHAVLPYMIAQGSGRIVNVGAESVRNGLWDRAPYNVAKGGVHALTTALARELAGTGITCNCVAPAATDSQENPLVGRTRRELDSAQLSYRQELRARMIATIPLGRPATVTEQAAAIAFLASDDSSYITGQVLSVNGGSSML
jgi:NAD(P)-dependent dehydrogenase (short-subunit alcohol dehydrogenase family)